MTETTTKTPLEGSAGVEAQKRLVVFAILAWLCTLAVSTLYPLDRPVDEVMQLSFVWAHGWVAAQAFLLIAIPLIPLILLAKVSPRLAGRLGTFILAAVPSVVLLDCLTFHWIGERFLSSTLLHICMALLPGLIRFVSFGDLLVLAVVLVSMVCLTVVGVLLARKFSRRWSVHRKGDIAPITVACLLVLVSGLVSAPALWRFNQTISEMRDHSSRHPFCAFGIVAFRSVGLKVPEGAASVGARLRGLGLADVVDTKVQAFTQASAMASRNRSEILPDIVIVIVESLQHSLINEKAMPNTFRLSKRGTLLQNHFSGGNASNLGIFSLINGIESSYFPHSSEFVPMMNQLLHQSGYQIGFYGGTDDWEEFGMAPFIKPEYYDDFHTEPVDWLASDQRSIDRATKFLSHADQINDDFTPRAAVVYLYSSHLPFASLPEEEVFQPAAGETFVSPYTKATRGLVFNRYRNSVRSLDRLFAPLLKEDRVIVVAGDHGESFMDDGTIGHGTRLSKIQNMTSAMFYLPGNQPRVINERTMHADILPTVMNYLEVDLLTPEVFEGSNLVETNDEALSSRRLATFHYMWPELMLIGPWTDSPNRPFGHRAAFSTGKWQVANLNPVNEDGLEWDDVASETAELDREIDSWLVKRFGVNPMREEATDLELIDRYLSHANPDVRLQTVEIASYVESPSEQLIEVVSRAVADESQLVRDSAKEVVIKLQKRLRN